MQQIISSSLENLLSRERHTSFSRVNGMMMLSEHRDGADIYAGRSIEIGWISMADSRTTRDNSLREKTQRETRKEKGVARLLAWALIIGSQKECIINTDTLCSPYSTCSLAQALYVYPPCGINLSLLAARGPNC